MSFLRQIIGAPAFFTTVWSWVKRWFDPVTVSKIFVLSAAETLPTLKSFIAIENIPSQYGGKLEFAWNDRPKLDATITDTVEWAAGYDGEFPTGPLYWVPVDGGKRLQCLARGTIGGKERKEVVASVPVLGFKEAEPEKHRDVAAAAAGVSTEAAPAKVEGEHLQPPAANGAALTEVASPMMEVFVDAPEEPLPSPSPAANMTVGVQHLTLGEKNANGVEEAFPNGKVVAPA